MVHWPVGGFFRFSWHQSEWVILLLLSVLIVFVQLRAFAEGIPLFEAPGGGLQSHESFSKDVFAHPSPMPPCCRRKNLTLRENVKESTKMVICSTKLNILLLCIPLAMAGVIFKWRHVSIIFSYKRSFSSQTLLVGWLVLRTLKRSLMVPLRHFHLSGSLLNFLECLLLWRIIIHSLICNFVVNSY